jgi:hypothetical protein
VRFFGTIRLRDMDRCSGRELPAAASTAGFHAVHMLSILRGIRLDSGEWVEAGEKVDSTERQQILRLAASRRKQKGDVVQLVRMLPCHGRGRGFEPRRPRHHSKGLTVNVASKTREQKRYIRENSAIQVQQQQERLPMMGAFFICGNVNRRRSLLPEETSRTWSSERSASAPHQPAGRPQE